MICSSAFFDAYCVWQQDVKPENRATKQIDKLIIINLTNKVGIYAMLSRGAPSLATPMLAQTVKHIVKLCCVECIGKWRREDQT